MFKTFHAICPRITFCRINLIAPLPVIYLIRSIIALANKVQRSGNTGIGVVNAPFGAERTKKSVSLERLKIAPFTRNIYPVLEPYILTFVTYITQKIGNLLSIEIILYLLM